MTAFLVVEAFISKAKEQNEDMSVLAYRTGLYTSSFTLSRTKLNKLPKSEAELLKKPEPKKKPQSIQDQLAMAKFVTKIMSKQVH